MKVRFWCEKFSFGAAPRRWGAPHHPLTRRTPPRSEKNGFEPEFEPPFWDILADMGGRPAIKSSLLAGRNNPTIEEEVDVI